MRTLLLASKQVVEVDTKDWKGNRLLDHLQQGEIKQMVLSRMVAEVMKAQVEAGFQTPWEKRSENEKVVETGEEGLTVKNLRKEVEKIQQLGKNYEFEDHNDESLEAQEDPSDQMLEGMNEMSTGLVEEGVEGERKRRFDGKSGGVRTVRFRGS